MVIQRINKFRGEDITRFLEVYEYEMANRGTTEVHVVSKINRAYKLDVWARVMELHEKFRLGSINHFSINKC